MEVLKDVVGEQPADSAILPMAIRKVNRKAINPDHRADSLHHREAVDSEQRVITNTTNNRHLRW